MKTFKELISEISQPNSEDELNFKEKHIIDPIAHPVAPDYVFSGDVDKDDVDGMKRYRKNKRLADYQAPEDAEVYEGVSLTRDIPGQEDGDPDNNGKRNNKDAQLDFGKHAKIKLYKIDEVESYTHRVGGYYTHRGDDKPVSVKVNASSEKEAKEKASKMLSANHRNYRPTTIKQLTNEDLDEGTTFVIPEAILATERDAFHTTAANEYKKGNKHFFFGGKKYPVTISKDAANAFAGKGKGMSEKVDEPYAVGMAQAMKSTGDKPPLEKKTIRLAHKIAKGIEKNEAMDPVHKPRDGDPNNDGIKNGEDDKYIYNRRKAITQAIRAKMKEGFGAVTAVGGDYDEEESHKRYKKSNSAKKEDVSLSRTGRKGSKIFAGDTEKSQIAEGQVKKPTELERIIATDGSKNSSANMKINRLSYALDKEPKKKVSLVKTPWNEEIELDELSKDTLHSYMSKAVPDFLKTQKSAQKLKMTPKNTDKIIKAAVKLRNRRTGVNLATKKMSEEAEQIDELSKDTLTSYAIKAHRKGDMAARMSKSGADKNMANYANKRFQGVQTAIKKLGEEDQFDEAHGVFRSGGSIGGRPSQEPIKVHDNIDDAKAHAKGLRAQLTRGERDKKRGYGITYTVRKVKDEPVANQITKEDLDESFKAGIAKLNDGSSVLVKESDAKLLNALIADLKLENKSKMMKVAMKDKKGFNEILSFAREAI